jgi:hypothetical protein
MARVQRGSGVDAPVIRPLVAAWGRGGLGACGRSLGGFWMAHGCVSDPNGSLRIVDAEPKSSCAGDFVLPLLELFAVDRSLCQRAFERVLPLVSLTWLFGDLLPRSSCVRRSRSAKLIPTASSFARCATTIPTVSPWWWCRTFLALGHARLALRRRHALAVHFRDGLT